MNRPDNLDQLIAKYSTQGPRYTSYPTAVEFTEKFDHVSWKHALQEEGRKDEGNYSLYVHLPFCPSLCLFCACHKIITKEREVVAPYLKALKKEILAYEKIVGADASVEQLHWGGGSPNYLTPEEMTDLFGAVKRSFPNFTKDADVSIELDPRTTTSDQLKTLVSLGFNRISMGVQDFDPEVQEAVNRIQTYEDTAALVAEARSLGIKSVGIDLIYGLPAQSLAGFNQTLMKVVELRPDRLALYGYAHVTWKTKVQKALTSKGLPTSKERIALFTSAVNVLGRAGYEYIGMDHFALPSDGLAKAVHDGTLNRNFMGYTNHHGVRLIGLGASSISGIPSAYAQNVKGVEEYEKAVETREIPTERGMIRSREDQMRGEIIESLLCSGYLSIDKFERKWGIFFAEVFASEIDQLADFEMDGLLAHDHSAIRLTELGRFFMRNIAMVFDGYLEKYRKATKPTFSQTV